MQITASEDVYDPAEDSFLAADMVGEFVSKSKGHLSVVDMGCGTGILGLTAAKSANVDNVLFVDINEKAVALARSNAKANAALIHARCDFVQSDLFSKVSGKFDIGIFNAPYLPDNDKVKLAETWSGGAGGIEVTVKFLKEAKRHIKEGGHAIIVGSSLSEEKSLHTHIERLGYSVVGRVSVHISFEDIFVLLLKV